MGTEGAQRRKTLNSLGVRGLPRRGGTRAEPMSEEVDGAGVLSRGNSTCGRREHTAPSGNY